jgi:hypothetical protein
MAWQTVSQALTVLVMVAIVGMLLGVVLTRF